MGTQPTFLTTTETTVPIIRGQDEGRVVGVIGGRSWFRVLPEETGGAYAILEQEVPAGGGPPLHVHRHETEIFHILAGEFELRVGDARVTAPAGTSAVCPRDIPHTFRNIGMGPGRLLLTILPGRFGDYFLDVDGLDDHELDTVRRLTARYGVEILE
jgi:quercetin dioxygenase-like cupin family protein